MIVQETESMTGSAVSLISPDHLGYSRIYLDFIAGRKPAVDFYLAQSLEAVADRLDQVSFERETLVEILTKQNQVYQASERTIENINRLSDPRAVCVFAGQQAGLYGGPLLTLVKALGVVKAAAIYEEQLGRPVIPMFWIAGDDHDFDEANHTFVLTREGELCKNTYQTRPEKELPTAEIRLSDGEELGRLREQLQECLGETDFTPELTALIDKCYTTSDTLVTAFGKLMAALTAEFGLVFFSPGDVAAKLLAKPLLQAIVEKQSELHHTLSETNQSVVNAGYHIQVEKKDNSAHLFYNLNGRKPILWADGHFTVGDESFTPEELLSRLKEEPKRFSPDVMTRPLLQSYLFPVLSQKGGPAEIAYLAQLNPLFELFDITTPVHKARPTLTILENRTRQIMEQMEIGFLDLVDDVEQVINRVLAGTFPENLEKDFAQLRETVEHSFKRFSDDALDFEPGMKKYAEQIQGKVDYLVKGFEAKVFAAHKKKSQQTRDRIYRMNNALYPHRGLQERTLNITYFLSRYGRDLIGYIYRQMDSEGTSHQLISLTEFQQ